jgi:GDP-mannose 6-dehydrogenase
MKISIFGLGYVGVVSGACLAKLGHQVIGVDINPVKVHMVNEGKNPILEKDLAELMAEVHSKQMLKAIEDPLVGVKESDISFICVGTPSNSNGKVDLSYVRRVCEEMGKGLALKKAYHLIVVRSTMVPGSTEEIVIPIIEHNSGKRAGIDFGVCYNPEFMREGSSLNDFYHPPMTVVGGVKEKDMDAVAALYGSIDAPLIRTSYRVAETVKYVSNAFHALKISFANEIGDLCKRLSIDSHEVMEIFSKDRKLNISTAYLKPGFAFGGSCLPKDLRALLYKAKETDVELPLLSAILPSNQYQIQRAINLILSFKKKKISVFGLSFKEGTDDLRESPIVIMVETLIGKGYEVRIYDKNISLSRLTGANRDYIEKEIPHIAHILSEDIDEALAFGEIVVVGNPEKEFFDIHEKLKPTQILIDLARIWNGKGNLPKEIIYEGICW